VSAESRRRRRRAEGVVEANLTPLIDIVFLLIVFFVLVAQLTRADRFELDLPRAGVPAEASSAEERRVVVNVVPEERSTGRRDVYRVGGRRFGMDDRGLEGLTAILRATRRADPGTTATLRAARAEPYERIHPALEAVRAAGYAAADIAVEPSDE